MKRRAVPDRRLQLLRAQFHDDGLRKDEVFVPFGTKIWARRRDVSDGERAAAGWIEAVVVSRFEVYSTAFTRAISPKDRLECEGVVFEILGIKEIGRMDRLEVTARARIDGQ